MSVFGRVVKIEITCQYVILSIAKNLKTVYRSFTAFRMTRHFNSDFVFLHTLFSYNVISNFSKFSCFFECIHSKNTHYTQYIQCFFECILFEKHSLHSVYSVFFLSVFIRKTLITLSKFSNFFDMYQSN